MNVTLVEGNLEGQGLHVGVAVASWNQTISDRLLEGAKTRCEELGVERLTILRVPGALELPLAARALAAEGCDAVVAVGAVVRGETDHYDIVVRESAAGISRVALDSGIPVANAVLAVHDFSQAMERAGEGDANKGYEAVGAAVALVRALTELKG